MEGERKILIMCKKGYDSFAWLYVFNLYNIYNFAWKSCRTRLFYYPVGRYSTFFFPRCCHFCEYYEYYAYRNTTDRPCLLSKKRKAKFFSFYVVVCCWYFDTQHQKSHHMHWRRRGEESASPPCPVFFFFVLFDLSRAAYLRSFGTPNKRGGVGVGGGCHISWNLIFSFSSLFFWSCMGFEVDERSV